MKKAIAVALGTVLSAQVALAQPASKPTTTGAAKPASTTPTTTTPAAGTPAPAPPPTPTPPTGPEKAGTNETLTQGQGAERPWAVGVSPSEQKTALSLFRDGNAQLNDGFFVKAVDKYREALKHWEHPAISYNLALALNNLDQPVEEYESLQSAMRFGVGPLEKDKFDHANELFILVGKQIAEIEVTCSKKGAKVSVDGKTVFDAPGTYKARVRIGKHTFLAEKEGYTAHIDAPYINPGENFRIDLKLYTADELTRYHRKWDRTWAPWVVAAGGVAVIAAGGALQLLAKKSYDDFDKSVEACSMDNSGCTITDDLASKRDSGDTEKTMSYVAFGVGAGAIAVGLTLAYVNRRQPYQIRADQYEQESAGAGSITVAPVVSPSMAGAAVMGRF